jgi:hypothetical protein
MAQASTMQPKMTKGRGAEQRGGVVRQHHVLVEQLLQHVIRLQQGRRRAALEPGAALPHPARQQRRQHQRQQDGEGLAEESGNADHGRATRSSTSSVMKLYIR